MSQQPDSSPLPNGPTAELIRLCAGVEIVLEAVEKAHVETTQHQGRDVNDAFLAAAYGLAYRRMRSIRELTGRGEADDAIILTRALVSLVGRSLYLVAPDDEAERQQRFDRALLAYAEATLRAIDDLDAAGFGQDAERKRVARIVASAKQRGIPPLPNDRDLLVSLGLENYYVRVYRLASDAVHYSIGAALDGFLEYPDAASGGRVALKMTDAARSEEALWLALITYGEFLQQSESVLGHGVTPTALRVVKQLRDAESGRKAGET